MSISTNSVEEHLIPLNPCAAIGVQWEKDSAGNSHKVSIPIDFFDFDSLDSLDDFIREELRTKGTAAELFRRMVALKTDETRSEIAVAIMSQVMDDEHKYRALIEVAFATGMMLTAKDSGSDFARQIGISKEAFQQGIKTRSRKLSFRKTATMRDSQAREHMKQANFRPTEKHVGA